MADQSPNPPIWVVKLYIALHVAIYRLSGGAMAGHIGKGPVGLLTAPGRKSGKPITTPLLYIPTDRGYAVIGSFAGAAKHPHWYLNLKAAGRAVLEVGRRRISVRVEEPEVNSDRYRALWRDATALYPDYDAYQARTNRRIPVVELIPDPA